jgi:hypothetical protein
MLSTRDRKALTLGLTLLAVLVAARFVLLPTLSAWRHNRAIAKAAAAGFEELEAQKARLDHQQRRLGDMFGDAIAQPLEPLELVQVRFVKRVEQALSQSGVGIAAMSPQPVQPLRELQGVSVVRMRVEATCRFENLAKCLTQLPNAQQLILVDQLSAQGVEGKPGELKLSLVLSTLALSEAP